MSLSARRIGQLIGLTAEQVNYLLKREGFLEGEPDNYSPTEKGKAYSILKSKDNGYGGYAARGWEWLEWDESILPLLPITDEQKNEIRVAVAEQRRTRRKKREKEAEEYWNRVNAQEENEPRSNNNNASLEKGKIGGFLAFALLVIGIIIKYLKNSSIKDINKG